MSYTTKLNLFKHNEPLDENENPFDIKTALNDNWDIIDDYADETDTKIEEKETEIQNLENILPKSTATGEEIYLNNSANYKFNYFNNGGNTHQDSYEGNQLIDFNSLNKTSNTTVTFINDILTISSTGITQYAQTTITDLVKNNPGKTLKFVYEDIDLSNHYGSKLVEIRITSEGTTTGENLITSSLQNTPYTIPNDTSNISAAVLRIWSNSFSSTSYDSSSTITKPMLQFGTEEKTYEPYVGGTPSPNPDYPQKVNNVGSNVNLFDKDNMLVGKALVISSGAEYGTSGWNSTNYIPVEKGKDFCINSAEIGNSNNYGICYYDGNKSFISGQSWNSLGYNSTVVRDNIIFNVDNDNIKYVRISIRTENTDFNKLKIEKGSTSTGYTPYNRGGTDVKVSNKNLFDKTTTTDGKYIASNGSYSNDETVCCSDYIEITPNQDYYISSRTSWGSIGLYDVNKNFISRINADVTGVLNITNTTCKYIRLNMLLANKDTLQFEKGSTASTYIAHAEQNITIPLPVGMELCKIGEYSNKIFHNIPSNPMYNASLVEGGLYKYSEIGKVVLNGSEDWYLNSTGTENYSYRVRFSTISNIADNGLCDHYEVTNITNTNTNQGISVKTFGSGTEIRMELRVRYGTEDTTANFKTWLSSNNVTVYYILATPTYTQITDTDSITALNTLENTKTYQGITNITSDNYPSPVFDVQYFLDLQSLFN